MFNKKMDLKIIHLVLTLIPLVYSKAFQQIVLSSTNNLKHSPIQCPTSDIIACTDLTNDINKCCLPDQGHLTLSLQWIPGYCKNAGRNKPCKRGTLKKVEKDTWTLHGLWPGNCDGKTYLTNCNPDREVNNIEEVIRERDSKLLDEMERIWLSGNPNPERDNNWFWAHEWNKHGQCVSTITPQCLGSGYKKDDDIIKYFDKAAELRSEYDLYPILESQKIVPSDKQGYRIEVIQNAFKSAFNDTQLEIGCVYNKRERKQYLSEVHICFHAKNLLDVEGPIDCIKPISRCNTRHEVYYAVNPTKIKQPVSPPVNEPTSFDDDDNEEERHFSSFHESSSQPDINYDLTDEQEVFWEEDGEDNEIVVDKEIKEIEEMFDFGEGNDDQEGEEEEIKFINEEVQTNSEELDLEEVLSVFFDLLDEEELSSIIPPERLSQILDFIQHSNYFYDFHEKNAKDEEAKEWSQMVHDIQLLKKWKESKKETKMSKE